ncbi:MAG: acetylglutamate kinase [Deltaproteobacteria bacterium]|nr:acetylglutamate kinase [Deltaproteobacteria bacterium]|tara:strand:- start:210 stop:1058 length:849 start_codon:yes stop_codon:yes gene_type:complete
MFTEENKNLIIEALSYIKRFNGKIVVVKYGGAAMIEEHLKKNFAQDIVQLQSLGMLPVIVHGGGPEVSKAMEQLGQKVSFIDGLRVTSSENLKVTEMVLSGTVNKEIIAHINTFGGKAVGVSGKDGHLIEAEKKSHEGGIDLGFVGEIKKVNSELLMVLLTQGFLPVVSPIGLGKDGVTYNINADTTASRIAVSLGAYKIIFMTDIDGVLEKGKLCAQITSNEVEKMVKNKIITGGMTPKVEACLHCVKNGVESAQIINGTEPHSLIAELFTDQGIGTKIVL